MASVLLFVRVNSSSTVLVSVAADASLQSLVQKATEIKYFCVNDSKLSIDSKIVSSWDFNKSLRSLGVKQHSTFRVAPRLVGGGSANCELSTSMSVKEFTQRFREVRAISEFAKCENEEDTKDDTEDGYQNVEFYKSQSCHEQTIDAPILIEYKIDSRLDDDWIKNIKKGLFNISYWAPGIKFIDYFDESNNLAFQSSLRYKIRYRCVDIERASTHGNIYNEKVCRISLSNKWKTTRFGTAMRQTMHSLGFIHEHSRKDRATYLHVFTKTVQYHINKLSQELTPFDPFSIMLYKEDKKMIRVDDTGIWAFK